MKNINFKDVGMYLVFKVRMDNYKIFINEDEEWIDCSREIKNVDDIMKYKTLYNVASYETLFKDDLESYEIDRILEVECQGIYYCGKNENGDIIRINSCVGGKHHCYVSVK